MQLNQWYFHVPDRYDAYRILHARYDNTDQRPGTSVVAWHVPTAPSCPWCPDALICGVVVGLALGCSLHARGARYI